MSSVPLVTIYANQSALDLVPEKWTPLEDTTLGLTELS
jgi:hypothetical protein